MNKRLLLIVTGGAALLYFAFGSSKANASSFGDTFTGSGGGGGSSSDLSSGGWDELNALDLIGDTAENYKELSAFTEKPSPDHTADKLLSPVPVKPSGEGDYKTLASAPIKPSSYDDGEWDLADIQDSNGYIHPAYR